MAKEKKKAVIDENASAEDIMRQFDRESATRIWTGVPQKIVRYVMSVFSLYCIWSTLFSTADLPIRLSAFLGLIIVMGFLTYPASKHHVKPNSMPWYDIVIMAAGAACFFYFCFNYNHLVMTVTSASKMTTMHIVVGIVGVLCLAELCRR